MSVEEYLAGCDTELDAYLALCDRELNGGTE